jgi:hypothetical protein
MIFSRDNGRHEPEETTNRIRAQHAAQFLLDTNKYLEEDDIRRNSFKTNNAANSYSIQKRNSIRYKSTLRRAIQVSIYKPADAVLDRQPRRLETHLTHTKQTTATPCCHRPLSRTFGPANLRQSSLPSDLIFDGRNLRA